MTNLTIDNSGQLMYGGTEDGISRVNGIDTRNIDMNRMVPNIRDEKGGMDLFSKLLSERVIRLDGQVDDGMNAVFTTALMLLEKQDPNAPIQVIINSPGGSVTAGLSMYDAMRTCSAPVHTVVSGMAASMGSILLCAGDKRAATKNSLVMIHQPSGGGRGTATSTRTNQDLIENMWDDLTQIYVDHSGVAHEEWDELLRAGDIWLKADMAKDLNLIDVVMPNKKPAPYAGMKRKSPRQHFNQDVVPRVIKRVKRSVANDDQKPAAPAVKKTTGPKN